MQPMITPEGRQFPIPNLIAELEGNEEIYVNFPYSDFQRAIQEDSLYIEAWSAFPLERLQGIRMLSSLSYHGPSPGEQYNVKFTHTRAEHALDVALLAGEIKRRSGFSYEERIPVILEGFLHDIATTAGGDATKKVDPVSLSEEPYWHEMLGKKGEDLLSKYNLIQKEIDEDINNDGKNASIDAQVLDIADRIAYVMRDLSAVVGKAKPKNLTLDPYLEDFQHILAVYPKIGNIYQDVGVNRRTKEVYFVDPGRLEAFLLIRALLHQKLYMHPVSIGRDHLFAQLIKPRYSPVESPTDFTLLTPSKLRRMTDHELYQYLWNFYNTGNGNPHSPFQDLINWSPQYEKFESEEKAKKRVRTLARRKNTIVIGIERCNGFDPATSYKVLTEHNKVVPFRDYAPGGAAKIEGIEESMHGVFVFYTDISDPSQPINNLIKIAREKGAFRQSSQN